MAKTSMDLNEMDGARMLKVARKIEEHHDKFDMGSWVEVYTTAEVGYEDLPKGSIAKMNYAAEKLQNGMHGCGTELCWAGFAEALFGSKRSRDDFDEHPESTTMNRFNMPNSKLFFRNEWPADFSVAAGQFGQKTLSYARVGTAVLQYYLGTFGFQAPYNREVVPGLRGFVNKNPSLFEICERGQVPHEEVMRYERIMWPMRF